MATGEPDVERTKENKQIKKKEKYSAMKNPIFQYICNRLSINFSGRNPMESQSPDCN